MKPSLGCRRFKKLSAAREERSLRTDEQKFLARHLQSCAECREYEDTFATSLNLLRESALEPVVSSGFDERVMRMVRIQMRRESLGYWSPAFMGASIACVAIFAALQIAATPHQLRPATLPDGEVRRNINADQAYPSLLLKEKPRLAQ